MAKKQTEDQTLPAQVIPKVVSFKLSHFADVHTDQIELSGGIVKDKGGFTIIERQIIAELDKMVSTAISEKHKLLICA